jgi:hypothetical protein
MVSSGAVRQMFTEAILAHMFLVVKWQFVAGCTNDLFLGGERKVIHAHLVLFTARNVSSRNLRVSSKCLTA